MGTLPRRFEPIRVLRKGGACSTFVATDQYLGRNEVVVKVIAKGNFVSDIRELSEVFSWYRGLRHPFLSEVLDAGLTPKRDLFYVRNYYPESEFFNSANRESVKALVSAVDFLRGAGGVHGAIRPSNIFSTSAGLKLTDPWTGRSSSNPKQLGEEDIRFGAPEVLSDGVPSLDGDLYSLGAVLYRFFSGRDPFEASDPEFLRAKYIWATPRSLGSVSHVSRRIAEIVTNLLDKDPARRGPAFEALKNELEIESVPALRAPAISLGLKVDQVIRLPRTGRGLVVTLVQGPAGSGKSRLVEELRGGVLLGDRPATVCEAVAPEPCLTFARRLVALADANGIARGIPSLARLCRFVERAQEPASKSEQEETSRDLADSIAALARHVRLLVVFEDIDRGGRRLTTLLEKLAQQAGDIELSVVATTRPEGLPTRTTSVLRECLSGNFSEIAVDLLPPAEAHRLSAFLSVDPDHRAHAEGRAAGNPGFLEQFCKSSSQTLPKEIRKVLSDLIAALPAKTKRVGEVLSLFEEPATWDALAGVSEVPESELREAIRELERLGLVSSDGFAIRYPDARKLLQSKIPRGRRIELHARCYRYLQKGGYQESVLANHAFAAGLYTIAGERYRVLANESHSRKDHTNALRCYNLVVDCSLKDSQVRPLDPEDRLKLAKCYAHLGERNVAQAILEELLDSKAVLKDPELLSSVYAALGSPIIETSARERVRLLRLAIGSLSEGSPQLVIRYGALIAALLSVGNVAEAEKTLSRLESRISEQDRRLVEGVRGIVLSNQGNFREAERCFAGGTTPWSLPGALSINLAVCVERLGDLKRAREIQVSALREAEASGSLLVRLPSLSNLGSMESKLGNIGAAEICFSTVRTKVRELRHRGNSQVSMLSALFADSAAFCIQKGDFQGAMADLSNIDMECAGPFPSESFLIAMTRCELYLELGQWRKAQVVLDEARRIPVSGRFHEVELLLAEERTQQSTAELCARLDEALEACGRDGTVYQECRVRLALARHWVALGSPERASMFAEAARETSLKNGYKPLAARALILVGLSTQRIDDRESALKGSLDEAVELRFTPLVAESLFQLGALRFSRGDYAGAQEYLSRCISTTSRLAESLNNADRKAFLGKALHRECRVLLNEASTRAAAMPSDSFSLDREGNLFATVYRLAASIASATGLEAAMGRLLQALKEIMDHDSVVVSGIGARVSYYPIRTTVSEETRKRIASVASSAGDKPYIAGHGVGRKQSTVIWMPILSLGSPGGIYAESTPGDTLLNERDIEFLTVVAAVAGAAFDRLYTKTIVPVSITSVDLYGIVGNSKQIGDVRAGIEIAARNGASVLIEGESGTGKELVARAIHRQSSRAKAPFIAVDCGALPEGLVEAELFGAKRGSYTGAVTDRQGLFEAANHGSIFLDEIANLGIPAQAKLLRVLQEREIRMIGSMAGKTVDVRLIAATNCNLERLVREGRFRQDLLYRLKVLHILIPPLRSRKDDIPVLATTFLERLNTTNQSRKYFGSRVIEKFARHNFPGNVRELQNAVERAFYTTGGTVITDVDFFQETSIDSPTPSDTENWFKDLVEGRENFWSHVHDRYKRRDISRERLLALIDFGLRKTRGQYKKMAAMLQIPKEEYHRFMDFLRRSQCLLDFRPYRKSDQASD